jgi:hypothetical protein
MHQKFQAGETLSGYLIHERGSQGQDALGPLRWSLGANLVEKVPGRL